MRLGGSQAHGAGRLAACSHTRVSAVALRAREVCTHHSARVRSPSPQVRLLHLRPGEAFTPSPRAPKVLVHLWGKVRALPAAAKATGASHAGSSALDFDDATAEAVGHYGARFGAQSTPQAVPALGALGALGEVRGGARWLSPGEVLGLRSVVTRQPLAGAVGVPPALARGAGGCSAGAAAEGGGGAVAENDKGDKGDMGDKGAFLCDKGAFLLVLSADSLRSLSRRRPQCLLRLSSLLLQWVPELNLNARTFGAGSAPKTYTEDADAPTALRSVPPLLWLLDHCVEWRVLRSGAVADASREPAVVIVQSGRLRLLPGVEGESGHHRHHEAGAGGGGAHAAASELLGSRDSYGEEDVLLGNQPAHVAVTSLADAGANSATSPSPSLRAGRQSEARLQSRRKAGDAREQLPPLPPHSSAQLPPLPTAATWTAHTPLGWAAALALANVRSFSDLRDSLSTE